MNTDTSTSPLVGDLSGTYSLQTMNGSPLPFSVVSPDTTFFIDTDSLFMSANGNWAEKVNFRKQAGTNPATTDSLSFAGTWTRFGNSLNLYTPQTLLYQGVATDTTLQLSDGSFNYVFKR
jgi:hypothetical protein